MACRCCGREIERSGIKLLTLSKADHNDLARLQTVGGEDGYALVAFAGDLTSSDDARNDASGSGIEFGNRPTANAPLGKKYNNGIGFNRLGFDCR